MSRISFLIFSLLVILTLSTNYVYAAQPPSGLPPCAVRTTPHDPLISTDSSVGFYINIGDTSDYPAYIMEFWDSEQDPDIPATKILAVKLNSTELYVGRNVPGGLALNLHIIVVKGITPTFEKNICSGTFQAQYAGYQCNLEINPTQNITYSTSLTVSGKNLTKDWGFVLFFDGDAIDIPNGMTGRPQIFDPYLVYVSTPTFGPKSIPQELMIPGAHIISLREKNWLAPPDWYTNPSIPEEAFFSSPLCPLIFTVGTPTSPGALVNEKTAVSKACTAQDVAENRCSSSAGEEIPGCGINDSNGKADPRGPGIATAIGCIHTNPNELVKDLMTFIIGIGGGLAFLMMLLGAFQMLSSGGNPETLNAGRERLTSAVIGLLFVIFAVLLMQIIGWDVLKIPGFGR